MKNTRLLSKSIVISLLIFIAYSCKNNQKEDSVYNKLESFLAKKNFVIKDYNTILVLSNKGCLTCNKNFAILQEDFINRDSSLIIVSAQGSMIDISNILEAKNKYSDFNQKFHKLNITKNSAYIKLKNNKVDTIIEMEAKNLKQSFKYIAKDINKSIY